MKFYTLGLAPMRATPDLTSPAICKVPPNTVVEATGETLPCEYKGQRAYVTRVRYQSASKTWEGYVYAGYLDTYTRALPTNVLHPDNQTPDPTDAKQYLVVGPKGRPQVKQVNLCGQFCVAYALGVSPTELMTQWEAINRKHMLRIFGEGRASGAWPSDLAEIVKCFEGASAIDLNKWLTDPILKRPIMTPSHLQTLLDLGGTPIIGVGINPVTGAIPGRVRHWVAIKEVSPEGSGGDIFYYNPYMDRIEKSPWEIFAPSVGSPCGIVVHKPEASWNTSIQDISGVSQTAKG